MAEDSRGHVAVWQGKRIISEPGWAVSAGPGYQFFFSEQAWGEIAERDRLAFLTEYLRSWRASGLQAPVLGMEATRAYGILRMENPPDVSHDSETGSLEFDLSGGKEPADVTLPITITGDHGEGKFSVPQQLLDERGALPLRNLEQVCRLYEATRNAVTTTGGEAFIGKDFRKILEAIEAVAYDHGLATKTTCRLCGRISPLELSTREDEEQERGIEHRQGGNEGPCPVLLARDLLRKTWKVQEPLATTMAPLARLGKELAHQDNSGTAEPLFCVMQKRRIYGVDGAYTDEAAWINEDNEEVAADLAQSLEAGLRAGCPRPNGYRRVGYRDVDEFVTACLTRDAAEDYLRREKHNLQEPFLYVESGYGNAEWKELRQSLMRLAPLPVNDGAKEEVPGG